MYRYVYTFDHLSESDVANSPPPLTYLGEVGRFSVVTGRAVVRAPWYWGKMSFSSYIARWAKGQILMSLLGLGIEYKKRVIFGFRAINSTSVNIFYIGNFQFPSGGHIACTAAELGMPSYSVKYIEVMFDFDTFTTSVFANGALVKKVVGTAEGYAALPASLRWLGSEHDLAHALSADYSVGFADIYIRDSVGEVDPIVPFGNVSPRLIQVADVSGPLSSPNNAPDAVAALNALDRTTSLPSIAYVDDSVSGSVFTSKMKVAAQAGYYPGGVCLFSSAAGAKQPTIKWKLGADNKVITTTPYPASNNVRAITSLGVSDKALDGSNWSWDKINQLAVEMTFP